MLAGGSFDGGAGTAAETLATLELHDVAINGPAVAAADTTTEGDVHETSSGNDRIEPPKAYSGIVSVRLSLEEALFMQMGHRLLQLYQKLPDGKVVELRAEEVWSLAL